MRHSRFLACVAGFGLLFAGVPVWSATIAVNVSDANPSPTSPCTLAQAIYAANLANNPGDATHLYGFTPTGATTIDPLSDSVTTYIGVGSCTSATSGTNTIDLSAIATQTITFDPASGIYPDQGWNTGNADKADNYWYGPNALPPIASTITIEGNGVSLVVPNTVTRLRFFFVGADASSAATPGYNTPGPGNLTLRNLTLSGGRQLGGSAAVSGGGAGMGGAVFNQGALVLEAVTLNGNWASGGNTSGFTYSCGAGMGADSPGIYGMGGKVPGGTAEAGAAAPVSPLPGNGGDGGGLNTGLAGRAPVFGGAGGDGGGGGSGNDSGIYSGGGGGGGFGGGPGGSSPYSPGGGFGQNANQDANNGAGGGGVGGGGGINNDSSGGGSGGAGGFGGGGGASMLQVSATSEQGGFGGFGGGGGHYGGGGFGGGDGGQDSYFTCCPLLGGGGAGLGGAVFNHFGQVTLRNSTLTANGVTGGAYGGSTSTGGTSGSGFGGAIFNLNGTLTVSFSTLDANTADDGGAIYSLAYMGPQIVGSTSAALTLNNSILAKSAATHDLVLNQPPMQGGGTNAATATIAASGKNLVMTAVNDYNAPSLPVFDLTSDPLLGALANNGGPTLTMLPQASSPVIDAAGSCLDAGGNPVATDQRGDPRPLGAACDLGAVETDIIFRDGFEGN